MLTREEAKKITDRVLSFTTLPECALSLSSSENAFIRYALNGITTSGYQVEQTLSISVSKEGKTGSTSVTEFDDKSLHDAVKRAEELSAIAPPNPEYIDPLGPQQYASRESWDAGTAAARNKEMIPAVSAVIEGAKQKNLVAAGFFERSAGASIIANKRGLFGYQRATDSRLSTTVRTAGGTSSGWAAHPSVKLSAIDGAKIGAVAIQKCERWQNPKQLAPGKFTVVLEPTATSDLVALLGQQFNARSAEEGRSFLSKKGGGTLLGEKMFPEWVTLHSAPFDSRYPTSLWGAGGQPSGEMNWIEKGVVKNLWYDRYWAQKANHSPTPQPNRLILDGTQDSLDDLIASVENGLLVTRLWYIRSVNPQTVQFTGLTRDGLFLIEKGRITSPVVNFRFNESPVRLLQNVVRAGTSERVQGGEGSGMISPPLVVKDFPFTSISDAV
jgi:predicted Zn-dependent protease